MKTLRVTVQFCFALCLLLVVSSVASASTLTLTGNLYFPSLDGSAQDSDGLANGIFTVADDLVLDGAIHCNDAPPLPANASACPIWISVAGDLTLETGSGIFAENRRSPGHGGDVRLDVGGDLTLHGPDASLPGAIVSTSQMAGGNDDAGNLTVMAAGAVNLEAGSILTASSSGTAGEIAVTGDTVRVAGLVASGHSRNVLPTFLTGDVLGGISTSQAGGTILLKALGAAEPALRIEPEAIVVSEGRLRGGRRVLLEGCGIEVFGLVASVSRNNGPSQVVLRSGKGILVDGRDLGTPDAPERRFGRIRADSPQQGAAGYLVDLFAESHIQVLGPDPSGAAPFAVSSTPGTWSLRNAGGFVTALSLTGTLTASGKAFETGRNGDGDKGGAVDLQAEGDVTLDGATVWAIGGYSFNSNAAVGGQVEVRSFQGAVNWTFGVGDVRPTGSGILLPARRGTIEITACTTVDITGTQFPTNGNPVSPFPVETEGVCSPTAPSLPAGELPLPVCAPANQPPAPTGGPFSIPENSPNGTVVGAVSANDPDAGQSHTFSIISGNTGSDFAIDPSTGEITVANSAALDFATTPSFTLTVQATDNGTPNFSGTGTVVVNLTDANNPPAPSGGPFTIPENSPNGTSVGAVSANDPDAGQTHTFSITNGNANGAFAIDATTGQITVANSAALNFEAMPSFTLTIEVTDSGSLTASATVVVNLSNVPEAPVAVDEGTPANPYVETVGNTLLEVTASPILEGAKVVFNGNVLTNDFDPDGPETFTATLESATAGAIVTVHPGGTFTYVPPPGFTGVDSFTYRITGSDGQFDTATVYINVEHRVWYVRNDAAADGLGRSTDPFDTLAEAESASSAGDTIYLFAGNDTTLGQSDGIALKSGQRLIGEALQLAVPATVNINGVNGLTLRSTTGNKPKIENDDTPDAPGEDNGVSVAAISGNVLDVEIRGLEISGFNNAIDVTATGANNASVTIQENSITGANFEGIDVNALSTGTVTLAIHGNSLTTTGTAIDVQRTSGTAYITTFGNNAVSGDTAGTGINVSGAIFDAVPGSAFDPVSGGVTVVGASGNGVGQSGLVLTNVQGRLVFTDLDVFADNGAGLRASSPTAYTGSAGLQLVVSNPGVATLEATGGPAVDISQASINLPLSSIKSAGSPTTGLALNSVTGSFSAEPTSSISNITSPAGTAFQVGSSNATITYKGTISATQGKGVDLTGNTGSTIDFTGTLMLNTGANPAFVATGGGTVTTTSTASTLTTTTATALNVANTTIGAGGLKFQGISSNGGGSSGIVLNNTGGSGGLTVSGSGGSCTSAASCTGGAIQNKTVDGISLNNTRGVSLTRMFIDNNDGSGIFGDDVTDFSLVESRVSNNTDAAGGAEAGLRFNELLGDCAITNTTIRDNFYDNVRITPASGVLSNLSLSGVTVGPNDPAVGNNGITILPSGSADVTVTVTNSTFQNNRASALLANATTSTGKLSISVTGSNFNDNNIGLDLLHAQSGDFTFTVSGNTFIGNDSNTINFSAASTSTNAGQVIGTITNNTIGNGTPDSGSRDAYGIGIDAIGDVDMVLAITNNVIRNTDFEGIFVESAFDDTDADAERARLDVTLTGNTVGQSDDNSAFPFGIMYGVRVEARHTSTLCLDMSGNTAASVGGVEHFRVRQRNTATFIVERLTDGDATSNEVITNLPTVATFIAGQNAAGSTADATNQTTGVTGFTEAANGFCRQP